MHIPTNSAIKKTGKPTYINVIPSDNGYKIMVNWVQQGAIFHSVRIANSLASSMAKKDYRNVTLTLAPETEAETKTETQETKE